MQRDRAARDERLDGIDGKSRIGAIADIVSEKHEAVDAAAGRIGEAGFEGLTIAVDVGEQRDQHNLASRPNSTAIAAPNDKVTAPIRIGAVTAVLR